MIPARILRLSLILPLDSPHRIRAAIAVTGYLLQTMRVELELLSRGYAGAERANVPAVLLVGANLPAMYFDSQTTARLERALSIRIGRICARHGVVPASFDLQIH